MKKLLFITLLLVCSSCIRKVQNCGYSFDDADTNNIQAGVTTKNNVLQELGSPSLKCNIGEDKQETWIYYSDIKHGYFFFKPTVKQQKVLVLTFNNDNVVATKEQTQMDDKNKPKNVKIVSDFTKKQDKEDNIFVDIVNNIGTVKSM